jgi:NADPH2:quinone reductase
VITALGAAPLEALEQRLVWQEQPAPTPKAGEVVIAVRAAAVGWVDVLMTSGQYQHVPTPPYTPGLEYAGDVVAVGEGAQQHAVGARVLVDGLTTGPRSLGAYRDQGGFASYAVAPESSVIALPEVLDYAEGACLLGGSETAYHALVERARVQPGEVVLVLGASGSTGMATVRVAKMVGARVLAVGRSADKLAAAADAGADHLVVLGEGAPSLREQVKSITGGVGADVVYDPVGGALSTEALRATAYGGRFVVVGWASTPLAARDGREANVLPTNLILMKSIDVLGSPAAISAHRDPALRARRLAAIMAWARAGELRPHVSLRLPLAELPRALHEKWSGRCAGNVVVEPDAGP